MKRDLDPRTEDTILIVSAFGSMVVLIPAMVLVRIVMQPVLDQLWAVLVVLLVILPLIVVAWGYLAVVIFMVLCHKASIMQKREDNEDYRE